MKHLYQRILSVLLCVLCVVGVLRSENEVYDVWDDKNPVATVTPVGTTYTVTSAAELAWIAEQNDAQNGYAGKTIVLAANIDLNGSNRRLVWTPIGTSEKPFQGKFKGNNHLVRGMISIDAEDGVGLFGYVGVNGEISGIGISGGSLDRPSSIVAAYQRRVGALAGVCAGSISECWSMAEIAMSSNVTGGLVGELQSTGRMTDTYCSALVRNAGDTVGVLVGMNAGQITRSYTTGYAKNGCAFVGYSQASAQYEKCYFDRKLYYQEPGAVSNGLTGIDDIREMFRCMNTDVTHWKSANDMYPQLRGFAGMDASRLSVAPVYIDTDETDPINHANDLTVDFRVDIAGGAIVWKTQELAGADWIIFRSGDANVGVIRPCTETDVISNATYRGERRTVYFRPRRVDDLKPGRFFNSSDKDASEVCFAKELVYSDAIRNNSGEIKSRDGFGKHHYLVVRYGYDANLSGDKWYELDTLPEIIGDDELLEWHATGSLLCDSAGQFMLRLFVHDDRCVPDWTPCEGQVIYTVLPELKPGEITTRWDTLYLDGKGYATINIPETEAASGGQGTLSYSWLLSQDPSGKRINGAAGASLNYTGWTEVTDKQEIYRYVKDGTKCDGKLSDGVFTITVFDKFREGALNQENTPGLTKRVFCTMDDAKEHIITASPASGGSTRHLYQWYMQVGKSAAAPINGATGHNLPLKGINLVVGTEYTFYRMAKDDTRFTTWTQSGVTQVILVADELNPGVIPTKHDTLVLDNNSRAVLTITEQTPATKGSGEYSYAWRNTKDGEDIANTGVKSDLTYTFNSPTTAQTFYRHVTDGTPCGDAISEGVYTVTVFEPLNAGLVSAETDWGADRKSFCSVEAAKTFTVIADDAEGGSGTYMYQWYMISGKDTTAISGATSINLPLSKATLSAGHEYIFIRQAKDNTRFTQWTQCSGMQKIYILRELDPGAIESKDLGRQCVDPEDPTAYTYINQIQPASGEDELEYRWLRINGTQETVLPLETTQSLNYYRYIYSSNTNITYTYVREVRQGNCEWVRSKGQVTESYGIKSKGEIVRTICDFNLPYTMHWKDSKGNDFSYTFKTGGENERWTVTDAYSANGCQADTVITLSVVQQPKISTEETEAKFCQNENELTITYTQEAGDADIFKITYSDALAKVMGTKDTTGHIITPGRITITGVPPLPDEEGMSLDIRVGASGEATDVSEVECNTDRIHVSIESRLGGYLHSKFSRMLFVDNNPENGAVNQTPKLHFTNYEWYKNGHHLSTHDGEQYYHENGQELNGVFYVILTDDRGTKYKSCELVMPDESVSVAAVMHVIYPVPVGAGEPLSIHANRSVALIISTTGEAVMRVECTDDETVVQAPRIPGIYYVRITADDGKVTTEKLIVK